MKINWKKAYVPFLNLWKGICLFFFTLTGAVCLLGAIIMSFNGFLSDTSSAFLLLGLLILGMLLISGSAYIAAYENNKHRMETSEKLNNRLKEENSNMLQALVKIAKRA